MRVLTFLLATCVMGHAVCFADSAVTESNLAGLNPPVAYYGGMPFYTAFHQELTTRQSLLKASKDLPKVAEYLQLTMDQQTEISKLRITAAETFSKPFREQLLDDNLPFDEDRIRPEFYSFLTAEQRDRLDRLAIEFDGCSALTLTSIADRLQLSPETRSAIAKKLVDLHDTLWMSYFRANFAGQPAKDHHYRQCVFVGQYTQILEEAVYRCLTDAERTRLQTWLSQQRPEYRVTESIRELAPLPEGLFELTKYYQR